jgi:copper chaperone
MGDDHIVFDVPDVSCAHCKRAIESAVSMLQGVDSVNVDVQEKQVDVRLSGDGATADDVRRAIEKEGYPVASERSV